jgi:hypothetical protein
LAPRDAELARKAGEWCSTSPGYDDVARILVHKVGENEEVAESKVLGSVYLIKSGKYHKVGRSNAVGRRAYEVGLALPEPSRLIHEIVTDDPVGIEAYWHRRFAERRRNGEWFLLSADDVKAFKSRRRM